MRSPPAPSAATWGRCPLPEALEALVTLIAIRAASLARPGPLSRGGQRESQEEEAKRMSPLTVDVGDGRCAHQCLRSARFYNKGMLSRFSHTRSLGPTGMLKRCVWRFPSPNVARRTWPHPGGCSTIIQK